MNFRVNNINHKNVFYKSITIHIDYSYDIIGAVSTVVDDNRFLWKNWPVFLLLINRKESKYTIKKYISPGERDVFSTEFNVKIYEKNKNEFRPPAHSPQIPGVV